MEPPPLAAANIRERASPAYGDLRIADKLWNVD